MARMTSPTVEVVTITPAMAEKWLSHNTANRNLRQRHIDYLKEVILRGEWMLNGDAIRFAPDGTIIDGQHRLWAIFLAEKPVQSLVVQGLPMEAQQTIDRGARRNLADALRLAGYNNNVALAATLNFKWRLDNGLIRTSYIPSVAQAMDILKEHPDIVEALHMSARWAMVFHGTRAGVAALMYEFNQIDPEAAEVFLDKLVTGENLTKTDPIFCLRRILLNNDRMGSVLLMALHIKAWNAYIEGREVTMLAWRPVGKQAEAFPEIKGY